MIMDKRTFIKFNFANLIALSGNSLFAKTQAKDIPNLLFVFLRGGADGLSMLVPYSDKDYYEARPSISIQKEKCNVINETFGLNPLLTSYSSWYKENKAVFIPLAGQLNNSRSHFQAQDVLEFGVNNITIFKSGFLGRLQEVLGNSKSISFTENLSPIMTSEKFIIPTIATPHLMGMFNFNSNKNLKYEGKLSEVYSNVQKNLELINKISNNNSSNSKLGNVANFMKAGEYNIGFVDFNDWDTHSDQGNLNGGRLGGLISNLDRELLSFRKEFGEDKWNNTLVVVMSEFGRTIKQNGNGSDHGHGNLMSLFGGVINKSKIAGEWFPLKEKNLHANRELQVMHQYRDVLAEIFEKLYGLNKGQIDYVFPQNNPTKFLIV